MGQTEERDEIVTVLPNAMRSTRFQKSGHAQIHTWPSGGLLLAQELSMSPFTPNLTDRMHLVDHRTSLFWKVHKLGAMMKRKSRAPKRSRRGNNEDQKTE